MNCYLWNNTLNELHVCFQHLAMIFFIVVYYFVIFLSCSIVWLSFSLHHSLIHFLLLSLCIESLHVSWDLLFWPSHSDRLQMRMIRNKLLVCTSRGYWDFECGRNTLLRGLPTRVSELVLQVIILSLLYFVKSKLVCFECCNRLAGGKVSGVWIFYMFMKVSRGVFIKLGIIHHHLERERGCSWIAINIYMRLEEMLQGL